VQIEPFAVKAHSKFDSEGGYKTNPATQLLE